MSDEKVIVTKSKLDSLATSISNKSGVAVPLTIAQMKVAVDSISTGGGGGSITIEEIPNATGTTLQITTNGSGGQTASGTFTGDNGITVQIPCSFEPDLIRVDGDLSGDVSLRGITSITFIKNDCMFVFSDTSSSSSDESVIYGVPHNMVGFNDSSLPHASYANGVLTIDMINNTTAFRFTSGITYNYKLSAGGGSVSSATQHDIYFEFSDETDATITAYYDDSFISDAITATTPTTYGSKTVTLAQLDGVTWYEYNPSETWETLYDGNIDWLYESNGDYPYCWISSLGNTPITVGSVYRVTYNNTEYRCTAIQTSINGSNYRAFGNPVWAGGTDDGSGVPFVFFDYTVYDAWSGGLNVPNVNNTYYFKIERLVTA